MGHLHNNPGEFDHTVSAFIINVSDPQEPRLLLHHHKTLKVLLQPGGHIELNETPWAAIAHEVEEETGYDVNQLNVLQPKNQLVVSQLENTVVHPIPIVVSSHGSPKWDQHYHTDSSYAFTTIQNPANEIQEGEADTLIWVTEQELYETSPQGIVPGIRTIGLAVFQHFLKDWVEVPFSTYSTDNPVV